MSVLGQRILIIEDDTTLGPALVQFLARENHNVSLARNSSEAFTFLSQEPFDYVLVDWLLPGMTGLDIVTQMRVRYPKMKPTVILMSGAYTQAHLIAEAKKRARTEIFLVKPFDLELLKEYIKAPEPIHEVKITQTLPEHPRKNLYAIFSDSKITTRKKRKVIEALEEIWDYDLPFIYSLLVETGSSGTLMIYHHNDTVSSISFSNGAIVQVDTDGQSAFFENLLAQGGYLAAEPKEKIKNENLRQYGLDLIKDNILSPHAFDLLLSEQMNISLSRTIQAQKIRINFAPDDTEMKYPNIGPNELLPFLHDWIASKIPGRWLQSQFTFWSNNVIDLGPAYSEDHAGLQTTLVKSTREIFLDIKKGTTINKLNHSKKYDQETLNKVILFLMTSRVIVFSDIILNSTEEEQLINLKNIQTSFHGRSPFEIFQIMQSSTMNSNSPEEIVQEYLYTLGPEPNSMRPECYQLWHRVYNTIQEALGAVKDKEKHAAFLQAKRKSDEQTLVRAKARMDEARKEAINGNFPAALDLINEVHRLNPSTYQCHLVSAWIRLGCVSDLNRDKLMAEVELEMAQVPPDEKYDYLYPFVQGLFAKEKGELGQAKKLFEKSLSLKRDFEPVQEQLYGPKNKNVSVVTSNEDFDGKTFIKELVGGIFRRSS